jgi:hypothetical protein
LLERVHIQFWWFLLEHGHGQVFVVFAGMGTASFCGFFLEQGHRQFLWFLLEQLHSQGHIARMGTQPVFYGILLEWVYHQVL